jgi:type IV pilus assembly protein PilN
MKHLTSEITALDSKFKTASRGVSEKEYHALLDRIGFDNTVIEKKMYNWVDLLDKLEQVVPDGIAISSIAPDPKSHELKLAGVARGFNDLRIFMEHLEDSRSLTDVYLLNQGESKLGDAAQGINFNLTCKVTK